MARRRSSISALAALAVGVTLLGLGGCGSTRYTYVTSTSTRTFLKVPGGWKVFSQSDIRRSPSAAAGSSFPFMAAFDADPNPSVDHSFVSGSRPFGLVLVRDLSLSEHDQFSLATLRNTIVKVDDLITADPNAVQVLAPPALLTPHGLRGSKLEYTVHQTDGTSFTVDQVGLVDNPTKRVWFLIVGCSASCYPHYASQIRGVVASWTVEGK